MCVTKQTQQHPLTPVALKSPVHKNHGHVGTPKYNSLRSPSIVDALKCTAHKQMQEQQPMMMGCHKPFGTMSYPASTLFGSSPSTQNVTSSLSYSMLPIRKAGFLTNADKVKNTLTSALEDTLDDDSLFNLGPEWNLPSAAVSSSCAVVSSSPAAACHSNYYTPAPVVAAAAAVATPATAPCHPYAIQSCPPDEDEDVNECRLDEDEWTESTGSSSLSSACFLHENNNSRVIVEEGTKKPSQSSLSDLDFCVSFPTSSAVTSQSQESQLEANESILSRTQALLKLPCVEILPGRMAFFQGAQETWNCISNSDGCQKKDVVNGGEYKFITCCNVKCQNSLCCVSNCHFVLCPDCCQITQEEPTKQQQQQPVDFIVAGLGFTFNDIRNWEQRGQQK